MADADAIKQDILAANPLMEPIVSSAIQALQLPPGSKGLDAGCGIGLQALLLASAVGLSGRVTGLDISPELLACAEQVVKEAGAAGQIGFQRGDVRHLPFENAAFDWAWSSCCVGYGPNLGPIPTLTELARVVRAGGTVAILVWSSERLLPGFPLLEARLNATASGIAPFVRGMHPNLHFMRAPGWLREVGLEQIKARTFVGEASAPLSPALYRALTALLQMRWIDVEAELPAADFLDYQRLCLPDSPDFVLRRDDYYAFYTCSMFWGTVVKGRALARGE